jgi:hypothetical protein
MKINEENNFVQIDLLELFQNFKTSGVTESISLKKCYFIVAKITDNDVIYYAGLYPSSDENKCIIKFINYKELEVVKKKDCLRQKFNRAKSDFTQTLHDNGTVFIKRPVYFTFKCWDENHSHEISHSQISQKCWDKALGLEYFPQPLSKIRMKKNINALHNFPDKILNHLQGQCNDNSTNPHQKTKKKNKTKLFHKQKHLIPLSKKLNSSWNNSIKIVKDNNIEKILDMKLLFKISYSMSAMALFLEPFFNDLENKLLMKNIGAISSKFFETVGWRSLGYEKIVEAKIDSMVFDIDQVVLEIDDLNINSTLNENDLLDQMYNNLSKIVFCHKLDTSRVKLNITEFQRNAKLKSGHTYMDKNTREKYFNIVSGNYVANPFKLSVKFSTNYSKGSSYIPDCKIFLWDKIVKVAVWLLINKSNQPYLETELTSR